jgi:hypothetical protein
MLDTATYTPRLQAEYREKIRAALKEEFGYKNDMMIPKLDKIVLNIGCGAEAVRDSKKSQVGSGRPDRDCRPEGSDNRGQEIHRWFPRA